MRYNIEREIEEIKDKNSFLAFHEERGHCLTAHILSDQELKKKLWELPKPEYEDDIVMATRFFDEASALHYIYEALKQNIEGITNWRKKLEEPSYIIMSEFSEPTGEGICKNTSKSLIKVHGIRIVLVANDREGRSFYIKTAYPIRTLNDNDNIYDAIDKYLQNK